MLVDVVDGIAVVAVFVVLLLETTLLEVVERKSFVGDSVKSDFVVDEYVLIDVMVGDVT